MLHAGIHLHSSSTDPEHTPVRDPLRPHTLLASAACRGSAKLLRGFPRRPCSAVADCSGGPDLEVFRLESPHPALLQVMAPPRPRFLSTLQTL